MLCNNTLTSRTVAGTEGGSVFVLPLKGNQSQTDSAMTPAPVAWRPKPPSQQLRDQRRAELHYTKVGKQDSDTSHFVSFTLQHEDISMCRTASNENDSNRTLGLQKMTSVTKHRLMSLHSVQHVPTTRTLCHIPLCLCPRLLQMDLHCPVNIIYVPRKVPVATINRGSTNQQGCPKT